MGHKEKHKKHKKEKSKKHKKEKKSKKHKKEKSRSKTCSSHSSNSSDSGEEIKIKQEVKEEKSEWGFLDSILSDSNVTVKDKKVKNRRSRSPEKPGQNVRELNPYWKDGGCGLPPNRPEEKSRDIKPNTSRSFSSWSDFKSEDKSKFNFLKPGEGSHYKESKNTYQRNWRKKDDKFEGNRESDFKPKPVENEKGESTSKTYTNDDLNNLAAKLVKAEIMGNTALINKLKTELETAKKAKEQGGSSEKQSEVVVVTGKGSKNSYDGKQSHAPSKRQKVITHNSIERVCYFPDDDKYSLKNLFEKEKAAEFEEDEYLLSKLKGKKPEDMDDAYLEAASSKKYLEKSEERKNQKSKKEALVKHKTLEGCSWCLDNRNQTKHLIVSTGSKCYLCLPEEESLTKGHCIIVPLQHEISAMHLDEDVWDEIKNYKRTLTKMFLEQEQDVVFFENARAFKHYPHCVIHCVPLDKEVGDLAPIYFQKAISESETEWSDNKKVIDFRNKELRRSIPKGLPYFAVGFGNEGGFAHIIEDEILFKKNFAEEVLGGMLDLDNRKWRKPQKENFRAQREKALEFLKIWKKFEFNESFVSSDSDSSSD